MRSIGRSVLLGSVSIILGPRLKLGRRLIIRSIGEGLVMVELTKEEKERVWLFLVEEMGKNVVLM